MMKFCGSTGKRQEDEGGSLFLTARDTKLPTHTIARGAKRTLPGEQNKGEISRKVVKADLTKN